MASLVWLAATFFFKCFKQNTIRNATSLCISRYHVFSENTNLPKYRRFTIFFQLLKFAQFDWLAFVQMTIFKLMSISIKTRVEWRTVLKPSNVKNIERHMISQFSTLNCVRHRIAPVYIYLPLIDKFSHHLHYS